VKRTLAALAATATCLILAGCGDDGSNDSNGSDDSGNALTHAELIEQGDAICKASSDRLEAVGEEELTEQSTEDEVLELVTSTMVPELKSQAEDLRELEPPAEDADSYEAMLDALDAGIEKVEADPSAALSDDPLFDTANKEADKIGFKECGKE
jgi:hypothetical protein